MEKARCEQIIKQAQVAHMEMINLNEALRGTGLTIAHETYIDFANMCDRVETLFRAIMNNNGED